MSEPTRGTWWHRNQSAIVGVLVGAVIALAVLCAILVQGQRHQTNRVQLEAFRNCVRANINSAIIRLSFSNPRPGRSPAEEARGHQIAEGLYPIVDCLRQQNRASTTTLSDPQTKKYIKIVAVGRFPVVHDGKVVGSRATLLEGVSAKDLTGE